MTTINEMLTRYNVTPSVGMGVTEVMWSDRHAWEVIEVKDARHITIRRMKATLVGHWLDQNYNLESDPNGRKADLFFTAKGEWRERIGRAYGGKFSVGLAREYRDPSF